MIKKYALLSLLLIATIIYPNETKHQTKNIYVVSYIKNKYLKKNIKTFYNDLKNNFSDINVIYSNPKDNKFYNGFRKQGVKFLQDSMLGKNIDAVVILHQKKAKSKIKTLFWQNKTNAQRNSYISVKKFDKEITLKKIISSNLKQLSEFLIIHTSKRVL